MDTLAPVGFAMQVCRLPVHGRCIQTCFRGRAPSFRTVPTVTRAHSDPRWRACFHSQTEEKRVVPNGSRRGDGKDGKAENTQPDEPGADAKEEDCEAQGPGAQGRGDDDETGCTLLPFPVSCTSFAARVVPSCLCCVPLLPHVLTSITRKA